VGGARLARVESAQFFDSTDTRLGPTYHARAVAGFAIWICPEEGSFLGIVNGWGTVDGRAPREVIDNSRALFQGIVTAAFPDHPQLDPAGASLVVRFSLGQRRVR
jgi:hypothetical protein